MQQAARNARQGAARGGARGDVLRVGAGRRTCGARLRRQRLRGRVRRRAAVRAARVPRAGARVPRALDGAEARVPSSERRAAAAIIQAGRGVEVDAAPIDAAAPHAVLDVGLHAQQQRQRLLDRHGDVVPVVGGHLHMYFTE